MMAHTKHLFFVHSMSRSGQHPIIDWIYYQYVNPKIFLNYMNYTKDGFLERRSQYYLNDGKYYLQINPNWNKFNVLTEKLKEFQPEDPVLFKHAQEEDINLMMMNFENFDISLHIKSYNKFTTQFDSVHSFNNIIIMRDVFNWLASKIKMGRYFYPETNINCWKAHALEFLDTTNYMENKICINYNKWCKDYDYRNNIATMLCTDKYIEQWLHVSSFGGGSSFDGSKLQGKGNEMKTDERWIVFRDNDLFKNILNSNRELIELSNTIFGTIPGTECLY